jgi:hypothetical protein
LIESKCSFCSKKGTAKTVPVNRVEGAFHPTQSTDSNLIAPVPPGFFLAMSAPSKSSRQLWEPWEEDLILKSFPEGYDKRKAIEILPLLAGRSVTAIKTRLSQLKKAKRLNAAPIPAEKVAEAIACLSPERKAMALSIARYDRASAIRYARFCQGKKT